MQGIIVASLLVASILAVAYGHQDHAHYKFAYGVKDPHTHDHKDQHEHREGHHVDGEYSLHEPDGTHRVVKYKSDHKTGFEAVVDRDGIAKHPHGATSYVKVTHWGNQGPEEHHH
nr:unnamed protein product [Callosobruchus chinensis]